MRPTAKPQLEGLRLLITMARLWTLTPTKSKLKCRSYLNLCKPNFRQCLTKQMGPAINHGTTGESKTNQRWRKRVLFLIRNRVRSLPSWRSCSMRVHLMLPRSTMFISQLRLYLWHWKSIKRSLLLSQVTKTNIQILINKVHRQVNSCKKSRQKTSIHLAEVNACL
jgi:hypothetical protein